MIRVGMSVKMKERCKYSWDGKTLITLEKGKTYKVLEATDGESEGVHLLACKQFLKKEKCAIVKANKRKPKAKK